MTDEEYKLHLESLAGIGLEGVGFTKEEVDDMLKDREKLPLQTKEERAKYMRWLYSRTYARRMAEIQEELSQFFHQCADAVDGGEIMECHLPGLAEELKALEMAIHGYCKELGCLSSRIE